MPELQAVGWGPFFEENFKQVARATFVPARIAAEHRGRFDTWTAEGEVEARLAGRLQRELRGELKPTVGDWVALRVGGGLATVEQVLPRRTAFVRRAVGERDEAQVVAANVDAVLLVCDVALDFNVRRVERFVAQLFESRAQPVLVLNKADLAPRGAELLAEMRRTLPNNVPVHLVSAKQGEGVSSLAVHAGAGRTVALVGMSGAGKSSLANVLVGGEVMRVSEVAKDGKGQHTTTHRQLIPLPSGGLLLDTPGMRELGLWGGESGIDVAFDDIAALAAGCRFSDCAHLAEPGCAVREAVDGGRLDAARLTNFQRLREEAGRKNKPWLSAQGRPGPRSARKPAPT
ncbi:MAG: ribosome small subunit-dependent GTPase A [Myxococcales bacterium]